MKKSKTCVMNCRNCNKIGKHTCVKDLTGSGPGYYQSTQGVGCRYEVWKCPNCKRNIGYTVDNGR